MTNCFESLVEATLYRDSTAGVARRTDFVSDFVSDFAFCACLAETLDAVTMTAPASNASENVRRKNGALICGMDETIFEHSKKM